MAELVKVKVTAPGVTDGMGDVEVGEILELPPRSAENLVRTKKAEFIETETEPEDPEGGEEAGGEGDGGKELTDDPEVEEYQKKFKALDKHTRDNLYEAAKEKVDIGYDINKKPLIEEIIKAGKTKAILDTLASK